MTIPRLLVVPFLALVCLLSGCRFDQTLDLAALTREPITVTSYNRETGHYSHQRKYPAGSRQHQALAAWGAIHTQEWEPSYDNYVPGIIVRGKSYTVNILTTTLVLHLHDAGSYIHDLTPQETKLLKTTLAPWSVPPPSSDRPSIFDIFSSPF